MEPGTSILHVLGTPLVVTTYADLIQYCCWRSSQPGCVALEFTNTHIVTSRRHDPWFRDLTQAYDWFIPDATPLVWCLRGQGASIPERIYGPTFMREFFQRAQGTQTHYFLGGSAECGNRLQERLGQLNPQARFVGRYHGRCLPDGRLEGDDDERVMAELKRLAPDFIWVGLGTPKQDAWITRHKQHLTRGILLSVGFAFDVNAGTKRDAPMWMQRCGLTWLFRMASEPGRLVSRYAKYNSLFLGYLAWDGLRRKRSER